MNQTTTNKYFDGLTETFHEFNLTDKLEHGRDVALF